jgi:hypothetical protein
MTRIAIALALLGFSKIAVAAPWESWWFPGFSELLNRFAFAFWWMLVFAVAAIPVLLILALLGYFR